MSAAEGFAATSVRSLPVYWAPAAASCSDSPVSWQRSGRHEPGLTVAGGCSCRTLPVSGQGVVHGPVVTVWQKASCKVRRSFEFTEDISGGLRDPGEFPEAKGVVTEVSEGISVSGDLPPHEALASRRDLMS